MGNANDTLAHNESQPHLPRNPTMPTIQEEDEDASDRSHSGGMAPRREEDESRPRFTIGDRTRSVAADEQARAAQGKDSIDPAVDVLLDEDMIEVPHVVPPDGGWGWVIVGASFALNAIVDGVIFSFGVLMMQLLPEFNEGKAKTAWIGSILSGFYLIAGPFVSALANRFGFRLVIVLGAVLTSIGFFVSSYATSVNFLVISYGLIGGIGFGMIYLPAVIASGFYFDKRRALATGIAVCGSGIGTFIMAPLTGWLVGLYGWRGTMMVQAGIVITCALFGLLFRPLQPVKTRQTVVSSVPGTPLMFRIKRARDKLMEDITPWGSMYSIENPMSRNHSSANVARNHSLVPGDARQQNGAAEALTAVRSDHRLQRRASERSAHPAIVQHRTSLPSINYAKLLMERRSSHPRPSVPIIIAEPPAPEPATLHSLRSSQGSSAGRDSGFTTDTEDPPPAPSEALLRPDSPPASDDQQAQQPRTTDDNRNELSPPSPAVVLGSGATLKVPSSSHLPVGQRRKFSIQDAARPMYREDIFYSGSVLKLKEFVSAESVDRYHASVTHLPVCTADEAAEALAEDRAAAYCFCCPRSCTDVLGTMLDFSLLRSPTFIIMSLTGFLALMGLFVPFMYLVDRAMLLGIDKDSATFIISLVGIMNTVGRVVCGWISDHPRVDALLVNNAAITLAGIATLMSPSFTSYEMQMAYGVVFGLSIACFASLRSILVVEMLGLHKLNNAFGLMLLFQGIAATLGGPITGSFFDMTGSYDTTFYIAGSLFLTAGIISYPLHRVKRWEERRTGQGVRDPYLPNGDV